MPTIATRAAGSARGFGFAGKTLNITEQTFTSSTTWTAPPGVINLIAVIGRGGSSSSDSQGSINVANVGVSNSASGSGANSLPISAAAAYNTANICANIYNAGGYQQAVYAFERSFTFYSNNTFSWTDSNTWGTGTFPYYLVAGTWGLVGTPLSGSLSYGSYFSYAAAGDVIYPGSSGGSTTAFGYTFSGASQSGSYPNATGQSATPVTYTNVAVTPGNSYSISVASGGSVTIQYLS
jgi:hypothetical protein